MALVVEDGTGLVDAESFISVADADTYFDARGNAAWAALTTLGKEQALRRSADYIEAVYGPRFAGERSSATQALSWPRTYANVLGYTVTGVPPAIARANAELALRASAGELLADQGAQIKQETVGPMTVVYADGARQHTRFAAVDALLSPYLRGMGAIALVRA